MKRSIVSGNPLFVLVRKGLR